MQIIIYLLFLKHGKDEELNLNFIYQNKVVVDVDIIQIILKKYLNIY